MQWLYALVCFYNLVILQVAVVHSFVCFSLRQCLYRALAVLGLSLLDQASNSQTHLPLPPCWDELPHHLNETTTFSFMPYNFHYSYTGLASEAHCQLLRLRPRTISWGAYLTYQSGPGHQVLPASPSPYLTAKPCNIIAIHLVLILETLHHFLHLLECSFCLLKIMVMLYVFTFKKVFYFNITNTEQPVDRQDTRGLTGLCCLR